MAFIGRFLTSSAEPQTEYNDEDEAIVLRLSKTLRTASLLEDRRAAVLALRSLAKERATLVGSRALEALLEALRRDNEDCEMARCLVETLLLLLVVREDGPQEQEPDLRGALCEMILKGEENLAALLSLLPDASLHLAYDLLQVLQSLADRLPDRLCTALLTLPSALPSLVELMGAADGRMELVRNEVVQLLTKLVPHSMDAQQMVVFAGAIDSLLAMLEEEGPTAMARASVVCEAALGLLHALLLFHPSNQRAFLEGSNALSQLVKLASRAAKEQSMARLPLNFFRLLSLLLQSNLHPQLPLRLVQYGLMELLAEQTGATGGFQAAEACHLLALLIRDSEPFATRLYHLTPAGTPFGAQLIAMLGGKHRSGAVELLRSMLTQSKSIQLAVAASCHAPLPLSDFEGANLLGLLLSLPDWRRGQEGVETVRAAAEVLAAIVRLNGDAAAILLRHDQVEQGNLIDQLLHQLLQAQKLTTGHHAAASKITLGYLCILTQFFGCLLCWCHQALLEDVQILLEQLQLPSALLQSLTTGLLGLLLVETGGDPDLRGCLNADLFVMRLDRLEDWLDSAPEILPAFRDLVRLKKTEILGAMSGRPAAASKPPQVSTNSDEAMKMLLSQLEELEAERSMLVELLACYERRLIELGEDPTQLGASSAPSAATSLPAYAPTPAPAPALQLQQATSPLRGQHAVDV